MSDFMFALLPTFAMVALGWLLAHFEFIARDAWRTVEKLAYHIFFPALIISTLATAEFANAPWRLILTALGAQMVLGALALLARRGSPEESDGAATKGVIIQSSVRWNTFVAVAIVSSLYGPQGIAMLAIVAAALIPTANIISVYALTHYSGRGDGNLGADVWLRIAKNPLVIACLLGGVLSVIDLPPGNLLDRTLVTLGNAAVALGLITAGAGIDLSFLRRSGVRTVFWSALRLLVMPLAAIGIGISLALPPLQLAVAVIAAATPTAPSGYILVRQIGGNAPLSANLIAMQSLAAIVTMPFVFWLATLLAG